MILDRVTEREYMKTDLFSRKLPGWTWITAFLMGGFLGFPITKAQYLPDNLQGCELRGPVKSCTSRTHQGDPKHKETPGKLKEITVVQVDTSGNPISIEVKSPKGKWSGRKIFLYDQGGRVTGTYEYDPYFKAHIIHSWTYSHPTKLKISIEEIFVPYSLKVEITHRELEAWLQLPDTTLMSEYHTFIYNSADQLVGEKRVGVGPNPTSESARITYDRRGKKDSVCWYDGDLEELTTIRILDYNRKGKKVRSQFTWLGDEDREVFGGEKTITGDLVEVHRWKYNWKGDPVFEAFDSNAGDNTEFRFQYTYDRRGNWIKKISTTPEGATEITLREIEYYF